MKVLKKSKRKILPMKIKCVNCRSVLLADEDDIHWERSSFGAYWYHVKCPVCGRTTFLNSKQEKLMEEWNTNENYVKRFEKGEKEDE